MPTLIWPKYTGLTISLCLGFLLSIVLFSNNSLANDHGSNGNDSCTWKTAGQIEEAKRDFYILFCSKENTLPALYNSTWGAGGDVTEQMIHFSILFSKLQRGERLSKRNVELLIHFLGENEKLLNVFASLVTAHIFLPEKEIICRKEFANDNEYKETKSLRIDVEKVIACGAQF